MPKPSTERQIRQIAQWPTEKFLLFLSQSQCLNYFDPEVASMIATRLQQMAAAKRKPFDGAYTPRRTHPDG